MKLKKRILRWFQPDWPLPKYDPDIEPHFIFILTPPYSGSTALAKLLNSGDRTMILQDRGEGQWMIPGLRTKKDRWDPEKYVNYESVKAVWLHTYQRKRKFDGNIDVVIEKSPPNMMRIEALSAQFKSCSFMANNRNPYAICASTLYRRHNADNIQKERRINLLENLADTWIVRSRRIRELIEKHEIPLLTYEVFCSDPTTAISALQAPPGVAESINPGAKVKVKDYETQKIINMNERQISRLSGKEIDALTAILSGDNELLKFYDYSIL